MGFASAWAYFEMILAAGIAVAAVVQGLQRRGQGSRAFATGVSLKLACVSLLLLALTEPYLETERRMDRGVGVLMDISESMEEEDGKLLLTQLQKLRGNQELQVFPFAGSIAPTGRSLSEVTDFRKVKLAWSRLDIGTSNLEQALMAAAANGVKSVMLLSDGFETEGSVERILNSAALSESRIFPLVPQGERGTGSGFKIESLHAPVIAPAGKAVEVRIAVRNTDKQVQRGVVRLYQGEDLIKDETVELAPETENAVIAQSSPLEEGAQELRAVLTPADPRNAPTSRTVFVTGEPGEKILLISRSEQEEKFLSEVLKTQSYKLETRVSRGSRIATLPALQSYAAVVLNNIAASELPSGGPSDIEKYVRAGGSLLMIGGNRSFGLGGYLNSAIEDALPVKLVPPLKEQKRLNVAVQLVLDKSGSMLKQQKIEYLQAAAAEVIRTLKDDDLLGILVFDNTPWIVVDLAPLKLTRAKAQERLKLIFPKGQTVLMPAMDVARKSLMKVQAGRKHMIILTDGEVPNSYQDLPYYRALVKEMRLMGITVSTFMIGHESDTVLREIAKVGGGAFHRTVDPRTLPSLFLEDIKVVSGDQTQKEAAAYKVSPGPDPLVSTQLQKFPEILGFVQTQPKDGAALELVAAAMGKADPLLASWQYGSGRAAAFTSDVSGRWSYHWVRWPKFFQFWTEVVDSLRAENELSGKQTFDLRYQVVRGELVLDVSVFREELAAALQAELTLPDGSKRAVPLQPQSRGNFVGRVSQIQAGKYVVGLSSGSQRLTPAVLFLSGELFGERSGRGFNRKLLQKLAYATGGKINPTLEDLTRNVDVQISRKDLSPFLLLLAAVLLCWSILRREGVRIGELKKLLRR